MIEQHTNLNDIKFCTFCLNREIDKLKSLAGELLDQLSRIHSHEHFMIECGICGTIAKAQIMGLQP